MVYQHTLKMTIFPTIAVGNHNKHRKDNSNNNNNNQHKDESKSKLDNKKMKEGSA